MSAFERAVLKLLVAIYWSVNNNPNYEDRNRIVYSIEKEFNL